MSRPSPSSHTNLLEAVRPNAARMIAPAPQGETGDRNAVINTPPPSPAWRRSSFCTSGTCIEVDLSRVDQVHVRDSKIDGGPVLRFSAAAWREFATGLKAGEFGFLNA